MWHQIQIQSQGLVSPGENILTKKKDIFNNVTTQISFKHVAPLRLSSVALKETGIDWMTLVRKHCIKGFHYKRWEVLLNLRANVAVIQYYTGSAAGNMKDEHGSGRCVHDKAVCKQLLHEKIDTVGALPTSSKDPKRGGFEH